MGNLPSGARCCRSCCCPGVRWSFDEGGRGLFIQFLERGHLDQDSPIYDTLHNDTSHLKRFIPYFQKVLPELSPEEIYWRLHFSLGALHYTITSLSRLNALSDGACNTGCFEETLERIIDYVEAGFRMAPALNQPDPVIDQQRGKQQRQVNDGIAEQAARALVGVVAIQLP